MKLQLRIVIWKNGKEVAAVEGREQEITDADLQRVTDVETLLERLTGLRFHINQTS